MASVLVGAVASFPDGPGDSNQRAVNECLQCLSQALAPDESSNTTRSSVISDLTNLVEECLPGVSITAYGSSAAGLSMVESDIDIAIHGSIDSELLYACNQDIYRQQGTLLSLEHLDRVQQAAALALLQSHINDASSNGKQVYHSIDLKKQARVPLLKFTHAATGIAVDVVCGLRGQLLKSHTISHLCRAAPMLAPLYRLVKLWARLHDLNNASDATFNSWSLLLMTLHPSPQLPPLWNAFVDQLPLPTDTRPCQAAASNTLLQQQYMQRCEAWLARHTSGGPAAAATIRWSLLDCLHWFMVLFSTLMKEWQTEGGRSLRASVWMGRLVRQPFARQFRVLVEEPFDCNDNTARSLGVWDAEQYRNSLPYVSHVFDTSERLLRSARLVATGSSSDGRTAFLWLFGCQGLSLLPPTLTVGPNTLGCSMDMVREARRLNAAAAASTATATITSTLSRYMSPQQLALKEGLKKLMAACGGPDCPIGLQWLEMERRKKLTAEFAATMQDQECKGFTSDAIETYDTYEDYEDDAGAECWEAEGTELHDQNLLHPNHEVNEYCEGQAAAQQDETWLPDTLFDHEPAAPSTFEHGDEGYEEYGVQHNESMYGYDGAWYSEGTLQAAQSNQQASHGWLDEQHLPSIHCSHGRVYQHNTHDATSHTQQTGYQHDGGGYSYPQQGQPAQWHAYHGEGSWYPRSEGEASDDDGMQADEKDEEEEEQAEEEEEYPVEELPAADDEEGSQQQHDWHQFGYGNSPLQSEYHGYVGVHNLASPHVHARQTYASASSPYSSHSMGSKPPTPPQTLTIHTSTGRLSYMSGGSYNRNPMSDWQQYARTSCSTPGTAPVAHWVEPTGPAHSPAINSPVSGCSTSVLAAAAAAAPTTSPGTAPASTAAAAMKAAVALLLQQPEGSKATGGAGAGNIMPAVIPSSKLSAAAQPWSPVFMPTNQVHIHDVSRIHDHHPTQQPPAAGDNSLTIPGDRCRAEVSARTGSLGRNVTSHIISCEEFADPDTDMRPQECIQQ